MFAVIIICWAGSLLGGACTTYNCKKEGQQVFNDAARARDAEWAVQAKKEDIYYDRDPRAIIGPNPCFYNDGSLKYDSKTGRNYEKGRYRCDSYGFTADNKRASGDIKRPPSN